MRAASFPADEALRLQSLIHTGLLDSQKEQRFDRLTKLAQQVLNVPIALISLVDSDRQWFKSCQGISVIQTPRDVSFCAYTILDDAIMEVQDASVDARFADNPLVTEAPYVRFYAGAPLTTQDGFRIGTLCVADSVPRRLTSLQRSILRDLADCVEAEIHNNDLLRLSQALEMSQALCHVISQAQAEFIQEDARRQAFDSLLSGLLQLTASDYGFIGEVQSQVDGVLSLKTYAIHHLAWDLQTRAEYAQQVSQCLDLDLHGLCGAHKLGNQPLIVNNPVATLNRHLALPGLSELQSLFVVPVMQDKTTLAVLCLANCAQGYNEKLLDFLEPLVRTIAQLITAIHVHEKQQQAEMELARLSRVASETTNGVVISDCAGKVQWINQGFTRMTGYTLKELSGKKPGQVLRGAHTDRATADIMRQALARGEGFEVEMLNYKKDGTPYWVRISCTPLRSQQGVLEGFMAIESDITAQRNAEQELRRLKDTLDQTLDCVYMFDAETLTFFYANEGALRQVGYNKAELYSLHPYDIKPGYTEAQMRQIFQPLIDGTQDAITLDTVHRHKNGAEVPVEAFVQYVVPKHERPHFVAVVRDITERKQNEARLRHLATHDALTGLPNRVLFLDRLSQEIQKAERGLSNFGVLLLDLDNFKIVNDSFGHHQGDYLLSELSKRLSRSLRPQDFVARLGGDEYAAILVDVQAQTQLTEAAERLLQVVREPMLVNNQEFTPSASIGYRLYSNEIKDAATLLQHADAAMYAAKAAGRGTSRAYCVDMGAVSNEEMHILTRLRAALDKGAFQLFYQPQVEIATGRIIGAEALLRWNDADLGAVSPARFIPVAEASGYILPLGEWVLHTACQQIARWHAMGMELPVSINLSPYQFRQEGLVNQIKAVCEHYGCPTHLLELEITESAAMQSPELVNQQLSILAQAGFSLSLDDFGTGHSSLARLGRLQVHKLKIDRSFIVEVPGSKMYEALVRTTINLGKEMGMKLIAEGVETEAQRRFLANNGCFAYQGWLFSKALPAQDFLDLVRETNMSQACLQLG